MTSPAIVDRSTALRLQKHTFGDTLRRLADNPRLPMKAHKASGLQPTLKRYYQAFYTRNRAAIKKARRAALGRLP